MLTTKMVEQPYEVAGADISVGAEVLRRAALDEDMAGATGKYFDNNAGRFASPHPDALDAGKCKAVVRAMEVILAKP